MRLAAARAGAGGAVAGGSRASFGREENLLKPGGRAGGTVLDRSDHGWSVHFAVGSRCYVTHVSVLLALENRLAFSSRALAQRGMLRFQAREA